MGTLVTVQSQFWKSMIRVIRRLRKTFRGVTPSRVTYVLCNLEGVGVRIATAFRWPQGSHETAAFCCLTYDD